MSKKKKKTTDLFQDVRPIAALIESLSSGGDLDDDPVFVKDYLSATYVEHILEQMAAQGVSRTELARRIGKSKNHLNLVLSERTDLTLNIMVEMAIALGQRLTLDVHPSTSLAKTPRCAT
ncbi:MAG: helix-turn-helix transcriptional regulator [Candidatus Hydrogenedentes bacterium]|nr:helix-turn-helix transcriptional regulator [Candidatus Hydrogenedentota bacterium]